VVTPVPDPPRAPGLHDVARLAGVSHQTVSRVVNAHVSVSPETRSRVLEAIATLGYRRNTAARALVTKRSATIGVVIAGSSLFGPTQTLLAVETAAREAGLFVSLCSLREPTVAEMAGCLEHFMDQAVEAVVVIAPQVWITAAAAAIATRVPVVLIAADAPALKDFHSISVDQRYGARLAVRHLVQLGHRTIVHLAGPDDWFDARSRRLGWQQELRAHKLPVPAALKGDWSAESGYRLGQELLSTGLPDAVFAANDQMALGLLRAMNQADVVVPHDLSVVGFDDMPGAAFFDPPLTTVAQEFGALGRACIRILQAALGSATDIDHRPVPPKLILRSSTAAPAR
jgi:DNA-binding LacI/PurR family transcriptional regulator